MAFRKKHHLIEEYAADIVIIQECETREKINSANMVQKEWFGENTHKGIGVFSYNPNYSIKKIELPALNNKWFVPFLINNKYLIIAVWAMGHRKNEVIEKIQPTYRTILENYDLFKKADMLIGDFNNNVIWDISEGRKYRKGKFSETIALLKELHFESAYHFQNQEEYGKESAPTHIWRKDFNTTYHIDYCFIKESYLSTGINFQLLNNPTWINSSDHYPFTIEFEEEKNTATN